jgi:hypothetical protein
VTDLVHGDFVLGNMLVRDGVPYVVDTAHAGKGTRAYDLATLLMETTVGGDYTPPSLPDQRRLERECIALVGRDGFLVCVACRIMICSSSAACTRTSTCRMRSRVQRVPRWPREHLTFTPRR